MRPLKLNSDTNIYRFLDFANAILSVLKHRVEKIRFKFDPGPALFSFLKGGTGPGSNLNQRFLYASSYPIYGYP